MKVCFKCGDNQQIDLKDKNYSAIVDLPKITSSGYVYKRVLLSFFLIYLKPF